MNKFQPFSEIERLENNRRLLALLEPIVPAHYQRVTAASSPATPPHDSTDMLILKDLNQRPFLAVKERADTLEIAPGQMLHFRDLKARLTHFQGKGFCSPLAVRMVHKGGQSEYWVLSRQGHEFIGSALKPRRGGTDYPHFWSQQFICHLLARRSIQAELEIKRNNSQVDMGFTDPATGRNVGAEVCLSTTAYEHEKVFRTLQDWDRLLIFALTTDILKALEQHFLTAFELLHGDLSQRVTLCLPYHIVAVPDVAELYECPELVFRHHPKNRKPEVDHE